MCKISVRFKCKIFIWFMCKISYAIFPSNSCTRFLSNSCVLFLSNSCARFLSRSCTKFLSNLSAGFLSNLCAEFLSNAPLSAYLISWNCYKSNKKKRCCFLWQVKVLPKFPVSFFYNLFLLNMQVVWFKTVKKNNVNNCFKSFIFSAFCQESKCSDGIFR